TQLTLSTPVAGPRFVLTSDGSGGTNIGVLSVANFTSTSTGIVLYSIFQNPGTLLAGSYVTNNTTSHASAGVYGYGTYAWNFTNYGTINATTGTFAPGIDFLGSGTVINTAVGIIQGIADGVLINGAGGSVSNAGAIIATGTSGNGVLLNGGGN